MKKVIWLIKGALGWRENHTEFIKNNRLVSKSHQRFKSEKYNVFTEEVNKIVRLCKLLMMIKECNQ